jgi:tRNA uridine 5-carbamoylmethylation protein Kti12
MNLILIYGPPAAGKLTIANEISKLTGYKLLDNHKATDYVSELFPRGESRFDIIRSQLGRKIRVLLFEAAAHHNVNLITTFAPLAEGWHDFIRDIKRVVEQAGGTICIVQLLPTIETLEKRVLEDSRKGIKADTIKRLHELIKMHPVMFETFPDVEHLIINNSEMNVEDVANSITRYYDIKLS